MPPHFASNDRLLLLPDVGIGRRAPTLVFPKKECCWSPRRAEPGIGEKVFITVAIMFSYINETTENGALVQRFGCPSTATSPAIIVFQAFPPGFVLKPQSLSSRSWSQRSLRWGSTRRNYFGKRESGWNGCLQVRGTPKKKSFLGFLRHVYPNKALSRIMPWALPIIIKGYICKSREFFSS